MVVLRAGLAVSRPEFLLQLTHLQIRDNVNIGLSGNSEEGFAVTAACMLEDMSV